MSGGLERARGHLAAAVAELEAACRAWGVWADEVRERAEQRLGAGPADPRVCCEPEYARALDAGRWTAPSLIETRFSQILLSGEVSVSSTVTRGALAEPGR